ncbi:MAG: ABC transporter substrate-binding protein [Vicinamibacterales bacterium]
MRRVVLLYVLMALAAAPATAQVPRRIVSLAPSVTESLFAIGAGDRVIGVTSYCVFPRHVASLPKVGGYLTPSYEALAALSPDLVVVLPEHRDIEGHLRALGLPLFHVDHRSLDGIVDGLQALGSRCGVDRTAAAAVRELRDLLLRVRQSAPPGARPRVLVCFGRSADLRQVHAAAPGTVHDDLLRSAGGQNVLIGSGVAYPTLSVESLIRLDPDVIIEFAPGGRDREALRRQWSALNTLRAVKTERVSVFTDDFLSVPGPRFVRFVETLARVLHSR